MQLKNTRHSYLFFCLLLLYNSFFISAQNNISAKEWLDKSSKAFEQTKSISIDFTINVIGNMSAFFDKESKKITGRIDLKNNKFYLITSSGIEIWFDGKNRWVLQKELGEVDITQPTKQDLLELNPINIFNECKKNWKYKNNGKKEESNKKMIQEIELIPQQTKNRSLNKANWLKNIKKIVMQINCNDFMPVKICIFLKNRVENIIYIKKYRKNVLFPDKHFVFDKNQYPNIVIVDLR